MSSSSSQKAFQVRVQQLEQTPSGVFIVWLHLIDDFDHLHLPGQYLKLKLGEEWSFFSIASLPSLHARLELHIQVKDDGKNKILVDAFAEQYLLEAQYAFGNVMWPTHLSSGVFYCRGTGFAPAKALIDQALSRQPERKIHFFWEAATERDMYFYPWLHKVLQQYPNMSATLCLTNQSNLPQSQYLNLDYIHSSLQQQLSTTSVLPGAWHYFCASPGKVYEWVDILIYQGVTLDQMGSDIFEYAPRG